MIKDTLEVSQRINVQVNHKKKTRQKTNRKKTPQKSLAATVRSSSHRKKRESDCFLLIFIALYIPSEIPQSRNVFIGLGTRAQRWKRRRKKKKIKFTRATSAARLANSSKHVCLLCVGATESLPLDAALLCVASERQTEKNTEGKKTNTQTLCNCALSTWFSHGCLCAFLAQ